MIVLIILIPYIDRGREGIGVWFHPSRRLANILLHRGRHGVSGADYRRAFLRGPGWVFYWPWQSWPTQ